MFVTTKAVLNHAPPKITVCEEAFPNFVAINLPHILKYCMNSVSLSLCLSCR